MGFLNKLVKDVWGVARGAKYSERMSAAEMEKILEKHPVQVAIDNIQFSNNAVEKHHAGRTTGINDFIELDRVKNNNLKENKDFKDALKNIFTGNPLEQPNSEYKAQIDLLQEGCQKINSDYDAGDLLFHLKNVQQQAKDAIIRQQQTEIRQLEEMFDNNELSSKFGIDEPREREQLKNDMIGKLKEKHSKELEAVDENFSNNQKSLLTAAQKLANMRRFIAYVAANDSDMNANLKKAREEKAIRQAQLDDENVSIEDIDPELILSTPVSLEDVATQSQSNPKLLKIYTKGGNVIQWNPKENSFSMKLGWNRWSVFKNIANPRYNMKSDMRTAIEAFKAASGKDEINVRLNIANPELAKKRAKEAMEACLEAGYPPDKIKIHLNGKTYQYTEEKKNDSFADFIKAPEIEQAQAIGAKQKAKEVEEMTSPEGRENLGVALRERVRSIRSEGERREGLEADEISEHDETSSATADSSASSSASSSTGSSL